MKEIEEKKIQWQKSFDEYMEFLKTNNPYIYKLISETKFIHSDYENEEKFYFDRGMTQFLINMIDYHFTAWLKTKQKWFDIAIFDFRYFSGDKYKAAFYFRKTEELKPYSMLWPCKVRANETYREAIERSMYG